MNAEIIAVGTELLLGDILNTNAQYLSREIANMGISIFHQSVVGDNSERLKEELASAFKRCDLVITTGGLGPTKDDLTKEIGAEFFNKTLVLDKKSLNMIETYFKNLNRKMGESNKKQAYIPEGAIALPNHHGTAPGCILETNGKILINLPGPPKEVIPMFKESVIPFLQKFQDGILCSKVLRISGIGESAAAEKISDIIDSQTNPTVAPYAKQNEVTFRITAKSKTKKEAEALINPIEEQIRERLGNNVYGINDATLESVVAEMLIEKNLTISVAESCTGGLVSAKLINYPGISSVFMEGAVTYSNKAKMDRLGVKEDTLNKYGAVSSETAIEMAKGIAKTSKTNIGISTTGIAGPGGGTKEKPVGLVYIGLYINGETKVRKLNLPGDRKSIREKVAVIAIDFLRRNLK